MKLRNKRTGEIGNLVLHVNPNIERESYAMLSTENGDTLCGNIVIGDYDSLAELTEEWEDYEEDSWYITENGEVRQNRTKFIIEEEEDYIEIGNYFETKEEAEKAVEKLKAWKRLKDHNLRVERGQRTFVNADSKLTAQRPLFVVDTYEEVEGDLDLLFGGEE